MLGDAVPETGAHHVDGHSLAQENRGVGMAEVVKPDAREAIHRADQVTEPPGQIRGRSGCPASSVNTRSASAPSSGHAPKRCEPVRSLVLAVPLKRRGRRHVRSMTRRDRSVFGASHTASPPGVRTSVMVTRSRPTSRSRESEWSPSTSARPRPVMEARRQH